MEISLAVVSDFAGLDSAGKLNILGIFHEINPPGLPTIVPQFFLVVVYAFEPTELDTQFQGTIEFVNPILDRTLVWQGSIGISAERVQRRGRPGTVSQVTALAGIPFEREGTYQFVITVEGDNGRDWRRAVPLFVNSPA